MVTVEQALVVGAGPVGLFAAQCLARRGVSVRILDSRSTPSASGYCGLDPISLAGCARAGVLPALLAAAHRIERVTRVSKQTRTHGIDCRARPPFSWLILPQGQLESVLCEALLARGIDVVRQTEVTSLSPRDGFVRVLGIASTSEGTTSVQYDSKYVLGADGHFSVCRQALGVELVDRAPAKVFAIHDFLADLAGWDREAFIVSERGLTNAFWPLGPRLGRWTFELRSDFHQAPTLDSLRALLRERAPWFAPVPEELRRGDVVRFEQRIARRLGNGRIWLAGDAAHTAWPIGFQSMNRGLREGDALAGRMARELNEQRPATRVVRRSEPIQPTAR